MSTSPAVSGTRLFVTSHGNDTNDCLTLKSSCHTMTRALVATNNDDNDDVIFIGGRSGIDNDTDDDVDWLCHEEPLLVTKSVSIVGYRGVSLLGCVEPFNHTRLLMITISGHPPTIIDVRFSQLIISSVLFDVANARVTMDSVTLTHVQWTSKQYVGLYVNDVTVLGRAVSGGSNVTGAEDGCGSSGNVFNISARRLDFTARDLQVVQTTLLLHVGSLNMTMDRSLFTNTAGERHRQGGLRILITNRDGHRPRSDIAITDSRFENQYNDDPIKAVQNLNDAALKIQVNDAGPPSVGASPDVGLTIGGCLFQNNERGFVLVGHFTNIVVNSSIFADNKAMHAGAGVLVFTTQHGAPVHIVNCTFTGNAAGAYREEVVSDYAESFVVNAGGHEVEIKSKCAKGVISFVGKGGGLRVQRGSANLTDCVFRGNTARLLGGAMFVDRDGKLVVDGVDGENSASPADRPLEGELIYSNGVLIMKRAQLRAVAALNQVSVLCHSGTFWSIEVVDVQLICPIGYRLRVTNTSAYKIHSDGMLKSYKLDQLAYFCSSCPRNQYSLDYGYLNQSLRYKADSYFTLLINGSTPTPVYSGSYALHEIACQQCPYGGRCLQGITAVPNFWGYSTGDYGVRFQRCNKGYCCSGDECKGFNSCRPHRVGTLCGVCEEGYSEAMFTADCVRNERCDPAVGYPVVALSCVLYFVFLLYQKDMRDLMFSQIVRVRAPTLSSAALVAKTLPQFVSHASAFRRPVTPQHTTTTSQLQAPPSSKQDNGECDADDEDAEWSRKSDNDHELIGLKHRTVAPESTEHDNGSPTSAVNENRQQLTATKQIDRQNGFVDDESANNSDRNGIKTSDSMVDNHMLQVSDSLNPRNLSATSHVSLTQQSTQQQVTSAAGRAASTAPAGIAAPDAAAGRSAPTDAGVSFLIIIFFYFQDAQLLHIKTAFTSSESKSKTMFRELLNGLFQFRVEIFQFMDKFCFLKDTTALTKILMRVGMVPCVLAQFGIIFVVYRWFRRTAREPQADAATPVTFSVKLATGFVLALLFTYQQLATTSFTLLNCVTVEQRSVLFIQGTIDCYQTWQYGVMAYAGSCILPFCLVLLIGPGLLKDDLICLAEFFVACIIPLPFLVRWLYIRSRVYYHGRKARAEERRSVGGQCAGAERARTLAPESKSVIQILQGPFKDQHSRFFGSYCGQGFLIGRRLLLVLLYTFVNDTLIRMLCIMMLCFIILLHHVHALPYKDSRGNTAGSVSAACLLVLGGINLLRAGFETAEYVPQGPDADLMKVLEEIENLLMLWLPGAVMGFVIITLTVKVSILCFQSILYKTRSLRHEASGVTRRHDVKTGRDSGSACQRHDESDKLFMTMMVVTDTVNGVSHCSDVLF